MLQFVSASLLLLCTYSQVADAKPLFKSDCHCWIGKMYAHHKIIDYGVITDYPSGKPHKQRLCALECSKKCASDIGNNALLCQKIGGNFNNDVNRPVGCFSQVGRHDFNNNKWDSDNLPKEFKGCKSGCSCAVGWYDVNRKSCVVGAGCSVSGMPNGDKGGGYWVWDGKMYVDKAGANCAVLPL